MLRKIFLKYLPNPSKEKFLVGVSGGKDSMALLDLFYSEGFQVEVAHANFQLRGEEANLDEQLVHTYCQVRNIPFHVKRFDTKKHAKESKTSTQMAARELRYQWFYQLLAQRNLTAVALAHHRRDNIETLFLNITKGTGPKGLQGIPPRGENIIRPILEATPEQILQYLEENKIPWREDQSNSETYYQRNKIRHLVLPLLKEINPGLEDTFLQNLERFRNLNLIFQEAQREFESQIHNYTIPDSLIQSTKGIALHLEEYLKPFGFTYSDITQMLEISESGKKLISSTHWLIKNQKGWTLLPVPEKTEIDIEIPEPGNYQVGELKLCIQQIDNKDLNFKDKHTAYFHPELIHWPLRIRNKKEGDRFTPFGMKGSKLVSDFLKDEKIAWEERVRQLVLEDQEKILWVVGLRTSDLCKVNPSLTHAIEIRIISD